MKAIIKKSLRIAGAALFVLAFTHTNAVGSPDGINLASFVAGVFILMFTETEKEKSNNKA